MTQPVLPQIAAGDAEAMAECLSRYGGLVWAMARRRLANQSDAEDAVQEVFLEIWKSAKRFDEEKANESTFIAVIARRRLIDRQRREYTKPDQAALEAEEIQSMTPQVQEIAEINDEAANARRLMQQLRPEERQVLELSVDSGLSHSSISKKTDLPLGTVKSLARRGLLRLRELLNDSRTGAEGGVR